MYIQLLLPFDIVIHFRFHLNGSHAQRLPVIFIHKSVVFTSDVLSPLHSVSWSAHPDSRSMPLSRGSTVAAQLRWFPKPAPRSATGVHSMTAGSAGQCLQNFAPRLGHAWRLGPAHTQGLSHTQLVYRVQVSPTLCTKFQVDCTVNNMKNPRCATGLPIRYVGLPFVILISFMYDMYFAVIVIWLCICLDPWSIKNYYYLSYTHLQQMRNTVEPLYEMIICF